MKVKLEGQFLENGSYHSQKTNTDVLHCTILVGSTALQITGVHLPSNVNRLDNVSMYVDIRAYGGNLLASYIPGTQVTVDE